MSSKKKILEWLILLVKDASSTSALYGSFSSSSFSPSSLSLSFESS